MWYRMRLRSFVRTQSVEQSEALVLEMVKGRIQVDRLCVELLVKMYGALQVRPQQIVERLVSLGVLTDSVMCTRFISALSDSSACEAILTHCETKGIAIDIPLVSAFMSQYAAKGAVELCEKVLRELPRWGLRPHTALFNVLMKAHCAAAFSNAAAGCEVVLLRMEEAGVKPDVVSFATLLTAYSRAKVVSIGDCEDVLSRIETAGLLPNILIYHSLLVAYGRSPQPTEVVMEVWSRMIAAGLAPNTFCFTTLMRALALRGEVHECEKLLDGFPELNLRMLSVMMLAYVTGSSYPAEQCELIMHRMQSLGLRPDLITFTLLMEAYAKSGSADECEKVMARARQAGLRPDVVMYNVLLKLLVRTGQKQRALDLLVRMRESDIRGNKFTTEIIASISNPIHLNALLCKSSVVGQVASAWASP